MTPDMPDIEQCFGATHAPSVLFSRRVLREVVSRHISWRESVQ